MTKIDLENRNQLALPDQPSHAGGDSLLVSRLAAMQTLNAKLLYMTDVDAAYHEMAESALRVVGCDSCALYLLDTQRSALRLRAAEGIAPNAHPDDIDLDDDECIHLQAYLEEYLVYVPDLMANPMSQRRETELRSQVVIPISCNRGPAGVLDFGSQQPDGFSDQDIRLCSMLVDQIAFALDNFSLLDDLRASRDAVIRGMALLAESRDSTIGEHLDRICECSRLVAEHLLSDPLYGGEVDEDFVETIARAAALHDVGKVGIPDAILLKPARLTSQEYEIMKTHTTIGGTLLEELVRSHGSFPMLKMGAEIAYGHHEWWAGNGYPFQRQGRDIPLAARIVTICDVFDALTSKRVYKEAWHEGEAFKVVRDQAGRQFDPHLAQVFLSLRPQIVEVSSPR
jgi:HD-GYP domain-containing protein (c-di-GMP phosphodiesterase class II)